MKGREQKSNNDEKVNKGEEERQKRKDKGRDGE